MLYWRFCVLVMAKILLFKLNKICIANLQKDLTKAVSSKVSFEHSLYSLYVQNMQIVIRYLKQQ